MSVTDVDLRKLSDLDLEAVRDSADALIRFRQKVNGDHYVRLSATAKELYMFDGSGEPGYLRGLAELIAASVFQDHSIPLYDLITRDIMGESK